MGESEVYHNIGTWMHVREIDGSVASPTHPVVLGDGLMDPIGQHTPDMRTSWSEANDRVSRASTEKAFTQWQPPGAYRKYLRHVHTPGV